MQPHIFFTLIKGFWRWLVRPFSNLIIKILNPYLRYSSQIQNFLAHAVGTYPWLPLLDNWPMEVLMVWRLVIVGKQWGWKILKTSRKYKGIIHNNITRALNFRYYANWSGIHPVSAMCWTRPVDAGNTSISFIWLHYLLCYFCTKNVIKWIGAEFFF